METEYDQSGQPKRLKNNGGFVYVSDARYDLFGRPTLIRHGNLLDDERTYYDAPGQNRHRRLRTLKTHVVGSSYLDLRYAENYTVRGQIGQVVDNIHASGPLSNRATYGYDALGRLTGLTGVGASGLETSYAYDSYGRITQKASRNIHYHDAARPHWPSEVRAGTTTTPVAHDLNGNRTRAKGGNPDYTYDAWDRLATIAVPGTGSVSFVHDYSGRRAAKVVNTVLGPGVTYYYSDLAELSGNQLFKSYYLGGLRVASQRKSCTGCELAALTPTEAIHLAAVSLSQPALVLLVRRDVQAALAVSLLLFGTGLLLAPWKRKRVVGIAVRHGHVILIALPFMTGTFPWPILVRPAAAQCPNPTPTPLPTATATPVSQGEVRHYHTDHLGSTQVVTDINGLIVEQIRYQPYGEVRGRFDGLGNPITNPSAAYRYEFTGYESEILSGLQYAGARFYDPVLGLFLTQDPAAQFASPYTYTGWDPVNLTDPNGEFAWLIPLIKFAIVGFAVGFAVSAIQAGINGAPAGAALKAGLVGGALGAATGAVLGPIGTAVSELAKPIVSLAYSLALTGLGGYGAYQGITTGNYLAAAVAMVGVAFGVKGAFDATKQLLARAPGGVAQGGNGGMSQEGQLRFAADEYDQSFSGVGGGGRIGPHRIMSVDVNQSGPITLGDPLGGQGRISSGFVRRDGSYHGALDIGAAEGTPIYAAERGVVSYAGPGTGYGRYIDVQHYGYDVVTRYGHVKGFAPGISPGSAVDRGQLIAFVGNVGRSSGPHLHFEVIVGSRNWVDPRFFLPGR